MNLTNDQIIESILLEESQKLINEGYDQKLVEQSLANFITGGIGAVTSFGGEGILQTIKGSLFSVLIANFGIDPKSFFGLAITNAFANLSVGDYHRVLTDCDFTTKLIAKSILESFIDQMRNAAGMDSFLMTAMKDTFVEAGENTQMYQTLANKLTTFVCPILENFAGKYDLSPLKKIAN